MTDTLLSFRAHALSVTAQDGVLPIDHEVFEVDLAFVQRWDVRRTHLLEHTGTSGSRLDRLDVGREYVPHVVRKGVDPGVCLFRVRADVHVPESALEDRLAGVHVVGDLLCDLGNVDERPVPRQRLRERVPAFPDNPLSDAVGLAVGDPRVRNRDHQGVHVLAVALERRGDSGDNRHSFHASLTTFAIPDPAIAARTPGRRYGLAFVPG